MQLQYHLQPRDGSYLLVVSYPSTERASLDAHVCSGAFKFRGAMNATLSLSEEQAAKGVVVHSSGNHAAAVALAAKIRGIPAHIVLPTDAPQVQEFSPTPLSIPLTSRMLTSASLVVCQPFLQYFHPACKMTPLGY